MPNPSELQRTNEELLQDVLRSIKSGHLSKTDKQQALNRARGLAALVGIDLGNYNSPSFAAKV